MRTKSKDLRDRLNQPGITRLVGAHNGLTARLVEEAGFEGVWASSLEISAAHLVPDADILTMPDFLTAAIEMNEAVDLPIVADVDQGYGNSNNVARTVEKFEWAGIAGVIMEDNLFPKQNSLLEGEGRKLASVSEFVAKIVAGKQAQKTKDFILIARVEALIAGYGQEEAMRRAKAYVAAGADGIMIHSKKESPSEIVEFVEAWDETAPLIVCPTKYPSFSEEEIKSYPQIKVVIYANHVIRTVVSAVRDCLQEIKQTGGIETISPKLMPVNELFELQGTFDMLECQRECLEKREEIMREIDCSESVELQKPK